VLKAGRRAGPAEGDIGQGTQNQDGVVAGRGDALARALTTGGAGGTNPAAGPSTYRRAHHVAHVEHSGADLRRGSHRHGGAGGVDGAVANDR